MWLVWAVPVFAFRRVETVSNLFIRARDRFEFIIGWPKNDLESRSEGWPDQLQLMEYNRCWAFPWAPKDLIAFIQKNWPIVEQQYAFGPYTILLSFNNRFAILGYFYCCSTIGREMGLPTYYRSTIGYLWWLNPIIVQQKGTFGSSILLSFNNRPYISEKLVVDSRGFQVYLITL